MSAYYIAILCVLIALILTVTWRLTGTDLVPYGEVIAIIGTLISITNISMGPHPSEHPAKQDGSRDPLIPSIRRLIRAQVSQIGKGKYGTLRRSIQQPIIQMGLWVILKFERLKSRLEQHRSNVNYRHINNRPYAEIAINDGSRQTAILIPVIRGRYNIKISGSGNPRSPLRDTSTNGQGVSRTDNTIIPYTVFSSNGYIWSIPVKPQVLGYRRFVVEIDDFDHSTQCFEIPVHQLADLYDVIDKYKHYIQTTNTSSVLAEAYD
jgi:hypothetical protein